MRSRAVRSCRWALAGFLSLFLAPVAAEAAPSAPVADVQLVPAEVVVRPGETVRADLVLRSTIPGARAEVSAQAPPALRVSVALEESRGDLTRWSVSIHRVADRAEPTQVVLRLGVAGSPEYEFRTIKVTAARAPVTPELMKVSLLTGMAKLQEDRPQEVHVLVENVGPADIRVGDVTASVPAGIRVCRLAPPVDCGSTARGGAGLVVPAGGVVSVPFRVEATSRSRTGVHQALFTVDAYYDDAGVRRRLGAAVAQSFEHSVLGESEFLTALGVPSFLVLPGFLMLVSYLVPARRWNARGGELPQLDVNAAEFLAISTTLSVLAIPAFWLVTAALGEPRTYLTGYGVKDLLAVWIVAVVVGVAAFTVPFAIGRRRAWLMTPRVTDTPADLLRRLARANSGLLLPQACLSSGQGTVPRQGFLVPLPSRAGHAWCVPAIHYGFTDRAPSTLRRKVRHEATGRAGAAAVWELLRRNPEVWLAWETSSLRAPIEVPQDEVEPVAPAPLLMQAVEMEEVS